MKWLIRILSKSNKNKRGFTLIELMVVVIVVGILAAAAIPIYRFALSRAYSSEAKASIGSMLTSMKIFYVDNDYTYPPEVYGTSTSVLGTDIMSILGVDTDTNTWWHAGLEGASVVDQTCKFGTTDGTIVTLPGIIATALGLTVAGLHSVWAYGDVAPTATVPQPIYGIMVVYDIENDKWHIHY